MDLLRRRIKERLAALEISARSASIAAGFGPDLIRDLMRHPTYRPSGHAISALAHVLRTSAAYLLGETSDVGVPETKARRREAPVLDYIAAGKWTSDFEPQDGWRSVVPDVEVSDQAFALIVDGDSMTSPDARERSLRDGDLVIVDPKVAPRPGDSVAAVSDSDHSTTLKQFRLRREPGTQKEVVDLVPLNPAWPTLTLDDNNPGRIIGTVVEHRIYFRR